MAVTGKKSRLVLAGLLAVALAACGGGDSQDLRAGNSGGAGSDSSDGNGEEEQKTSLSMELVDSTGVSVGTTNRPITETRPATVRFQINNPPPGFDMANQVISFSASLGTLDPSSGTSLTDDNGLAMIELQAGESPGAGLLTASISIAGEVVQAVTGYQIEEASNTGGDSGEVNVLLGVGSLGDFADGQVGLSETEVGVGSSLSVRANLVEEDTKEPWSGYTEINFSSDCAQAGTAELDPSSVVATGGVALASYVPLSGCFNDVVRATTTINGEQISAVSETITIEQSPVASLEFLGAEPARIGLAGSGAGGREETSVLRFQLKDSNGEAVGAGEEVEFEIGTGAGGFGIVSSPQQSTDPQGIVAVTVKSGSVPIVGSVIARVVSDSDIKATGQVAVNSGLVTQDRFSIALGVLNPLAFDHLGVTVPVTVRAADRFGNWAPDGTLINFSSELGDIEPTCETVNGTCEVTWTSQGPQMINFDTDREDRTNRDGCASISTVHDVVAIERSGLASTVECGVKDRFGRNTIVAWTVGEESFKDLNGDNLFDTSEQYYQLPEAFRDDNETRVRDGADDPLYPEEFMDFNQDGVYSQASGFFRGIGCTEVARVEGHCSLLANVRATAVMALSTDDVNLTANLALIDVSAMSEGEIVVRVEDGNGLAPANGTEVEFDSGDLDAIGNTSCVVPNALEPHVCTFRYKRPDSVENECQSVLVTATTPAPALLESVISIPVTGCIQE